jgi:hypothetical protein
VTRLINIPPAKDHEPELRLEAVEKR